MQNLKNNVILLTARFGVSRPKILLGARHIILGEMKYMTDGTDQKETFDENSPSNVAVEKS